MAWVLSQWVAAKRVLIDPLLTKSSASHAAEVPIGRATMKNGSKKSWFGKVFRFSRVVRQRLRAKTWAAVALCAVGRAAERDGNLAL